MSVARFFAQSQGKAFTDISTTTGTRQKHNKHLNLNFTARPQPDPRPQTQDPSRLGGMHCENGRRAKGLGRGSFREPQTSAFGEPGKRPMEKSCTLAARTCQCAASSSTTCPMASALSVSTFPPPNLHTKPRRP